MPDRDQFDINASRRFADDRHHNPRDARMEDRSFNRENAGPRREDREPASGREGAAGFGYGDGGFNAYGQMARGGSNQNDGGFGVSGGYESGGLGSQGGQGGFGPINRGASYGEGGGRFGPQGYDEPYGGRWGAMGGQTHDRDRTAHDHDHEPGYRHWRDTQLSGHDRDYAAWRDQQAKRYDEEYKTWRDDRHATFGREFEGWRTSRGGASSGADAKVQDSAGRPPASSSSSASAASAGEGGVHGSNPTLAHIAEGDTDQRHAKHEAEKRDDAPRH